MEKVINCVGAYNCIILELILPSFRHDYFIRENRGFGRFDQNMYNRSISFKALFESHLIYKLRYNRQTIFNQLNIMVPYVNIIGLRNSVAIL